MSKKTRRSLLQDSLDDDQGGNRKVPLKRNILQGAPPSDFELMDAMMLRITVLEDTLCSQAQKMNQKEDVISVLEERLWSQEESNLKDTSSRRDLERQCELLQNKVQEMEILINDYGLIWLGVTKDWEITSTGLAADTGFQMNFDLVLQRIRELNNVTGEGESYVQATGTGAKLAKKDPIRLELYKDGIVMFDGPFYSYQERCTQLVMQDLMDGYFPSKLQQRLSDGAAFEVQDRRDEEFMARLPRDIFPGDGQAVCGDESMTSFDSKPDRELTTDRFLQKLPKMVIKDGNVINIRGSLKRSLQSSSNALISSSEILINTPTLQAVMDRTQITKPQQAVVALKVKSEDGNETYVMKMSLSETVGQLRGYLDKHRGEGQTGYDILSAFPHRCLGDDSWTLQSCDIMSNTTLLLQQRKQTSQ